MKIELYNTFKDQIELLPRVTIIYSSDTNSYYRGFAMEWLWFGVFFTKKIR